MMNKKASENASTAADNFEVQQDPIDVSVYKTRIIMKPESILPEVELSTGIQ